MWDVLHSFGTGIAFALGVLAGAWMIRMVDRKDRKQERLSWEGHHRRVEDRLAKYVEHMGMLARIAEKWDKRQEG